MMNLIEPNIHPVFVHFAYALMTLSALLMFAVSVMTDSNRRETLRHAGDWMMAFGVIALIATVAAGFQAFYSVAHDVPSHAAMMVHRNWAVPTATALIVLSAWRWTKRLEMPSTSFASLFLIACFSLSVTAWWGGRLVFEHGLGVSSLPQTTGPGHDHNHNKPATRSGSDEKQDFPETTGPHHDSLNTEHPH